MSVRVHPSTASFQQLGVLLRQPWLVLLCTQSIMLLSASMPDSSFSGIVRESLATMAGKEISLETIESVDQTRLTDPGRAPAGRGVTDMHATSARIRFSGGQLTRWTMASFIVALLIGIAAGLARSVRATAKP